MNRITQLLSERSSLRRRLRESEARLAKAQQLGRMGWWRFDQAADHTEVSREIYPMFGLDPAAGTRLTLELWMSLIHDEDRDQVMKTMDLSIVERKPHDIYFRVVHLDGNERMLFSRAEPLIGPHGELLGLYGITQDVTEKWQAHRALEKLAAIVQQAPDAIIRTDLEGRIESWNPAAERLYGYSEDEVLGWPVSVLYQAGHAERELQSLLGEVLAGRPIQTETERVAKDGRTIPVEILVSPLRDSRTGALLGASSFARDLTPALRARDEREQLQRRLNQSQRLETMGQLAGGIAHDFNNLLAVIANYAEFVRDELPEDSEVREDVEEISRAAQRATTLTRQLLVFSRREVVHPEVLDLNEAVSDMQKLLGRTLGEDVELFVKLGGSLAPVYADRGQVEQVLMNLAVNARDAMPDGGGLTIETSEVLVDDEAATASDDLTPGRHVRLSVTDTGCGMSAEVAAKAFEPFFSTKEKGRGTGLGLATVYGIVREAGGSILIYSEPGQGTTVRIYWPVLGSDEDEPEAVDTPRGAGETILVVDDDEAVRQSAVRILTGGGYAALEAASAEEALVLCDESTAIHALLADVVIHDVLGGELAEQLRARRGDLKVVYMSGYGDRGDGRGAELPRVEKPFSTKTLLSAVGSALRGETKGGAA
jgi:two-component system, cell cycle sensor histidine kinase and response regulator CckA